MSVDPAEVFGFGPTARIVYRNREGVTAIRTIVPKSIWYGDSEWHPGQQWLLGAFDVDRQEPRTFAMKDIKEWLS